MLIILVPLIRLLSLISLIILDKSIALTKFFTIFEHITLWLYACAGRVNIKRMSTHKNQNLCTSPCGCAYAGRAPRVHFHVRVVPMTGKKVSQILQFLE